MPGTTRAADAALFPRDGGSADLSTYQVVAQTVAELRDPANAPALTMPPYLLATGQLALLAKLSIYSERGVTREQARLLYLNSTALELWQAMGRHPTLTGSRHRPPKGALLALGVPFSD